jgi:signal transduction histidine kinase/CheY-like chemotaxis protein
MESDGFNWNRIKKFSLQFDDPLEERVFKLNLWNEEKVIIRGFSWIILLHSIYLVVVKYILQPATMVALSQHLIHYVLYFPISISIIVLAIINPFKAKWTQRVWYTLLSIASVMVALGILLRTFLCHFGIDSTESCLQENRPVASANYSIIYILLGPFLILTVMQNRIAYQLPAIVIIVIMIIAAIAIVIPETTVVTYLNIIFIIGAQVMAILVSWARNKTQRSRYIVNRDNIQLTEKLRREIQWKTEAQEKAVEEEEKRTQFTSMLFHEMRVPLNSVMLSINDLQSDDGVQNRITQETKETLDSIGTGLSAIATVINESLDFRKIKEGKYTIHQVPFVFRKVVEDVIRSMESNWKSKDITFVLDYDPRLDSLRNKLSGDPQRLRQIIANYLSNAAKFTPAGGTITLQIRQEDSSLDEGTVSIYTHVQDTGIGIRADDQVKLFKPFVQIDPENLQGGKGSGLGLSIVASIVKSMGGTYGVISEYGNGSTFWFRATFNITDVSKDALDDDERISIEIQSAPPSLRILVTDDDSMTRKIMKKLLVRLGHTVEEASDGIECLNKVEEWVNNGEVFDLIFLDNIMPRMSGLETIRILRQRGFNVPIVSLTGSGNGDIASQLTAAGATKVLMKPATLSMLKEAIYEYQQTK